MDVQMRIAMIVIGYVFSKLGLSVTCVDRPPGIPRAVAGAGVRRAGHERGR
jgi:hypothetical protein